MIDHLLGAVRVDLIELNAPGNGIPFQIEERVISIGFLPFVGPQLQAFLDDFGVVACQHYVLVLVALLVHLRILFALLEGFLLHLQQSFSLPDHDHFRV